MITWSEGLSYATAAIFLALALVSVVRWGRNGSGQAARWAALAFASLGFVLLESIVVEEPSRFLERVSIGILILFPYFLFRFATSFSATTRWINQCAIALTGAVGAFVVFLPEFPNEGDPRSTVFTLFTFLLLAQWSALSMVAVTRLWRAGAKQPTVARRRMRTMSLGAIGLNVALLASAAQSSARGMDLGIHLLTAFAGATFYIGFAPPRWLLTLWRQPEQSKLQESVRRLMGAATRDEVASALLPHVVGIVGGLGVALVESDGSVVAEYHREGYSSLGGDSEDQQHLHRIPLGDGTIHLHVWTSPYTPYFGREEFDLLQRLGTLAHLALERVRLSEGERLSRAALEQANSNLLTLNDELQREVAERNRAEAELSMAREEADRANFAKSEFLSRMSHELRTPLNSILGFGQLLEMNALDADDTKSVHYILKAGHHLLDLINEVLDISRIESGTMTLSLEPTLASGIVQEAVELIQPIARRHGVALQSELNGGSELCINVDRHRLRQVLLNLFSNAVKYNREEGSVTVLMSKQANSELRIEIRDTGLGIRPERLDKLFVPFERLGAEGSAVEGTGLGLSLSKSLVELMNGRIGVDSVVGSGSTFWIQFPTTERSAFPVTPIGISRSVTAGSPMRTVLYIEDNLSNLVLIETILSARENVRLLTAMQAGIGLDLAREHHPDLILLDLHLPDMPGEEALRLLRRSSWTRNIPVIVVSADATQGQVQRLLDGGANAYLTKPLDVTSFLKAVDEAMSAEEAALR